MEDVVIKHVCSICGQEFPTEEEYLTHVCPHTAFTPMDFEHQVALDPNFQAISDSALARGAATQTNDQSPEANTEE